MPPLPVLRKDLLVLAKMLGMLGTASDHERAAVGAKVNAWITQRGLVWTDLLIPVEPEEVRAAPQRPAQAPPGPQHSNSATGHNWARGPAWGALAEQMLAEHADRLRGDREVTFLTDQLSRAMTFGNGVRISDKQEAWLRDILGRAGLTW